MIINFTRMAVILTAFGFLYACSPAGHLGQAENHLQNNRLNEAVQSAERAISAEPDNPMPYIVKASAHNALAKAATPSNRATHYIEMTTALDMASKMAGLQGAYDLVEKAESIRIDAFDFEYGTAASFLSDGQDAVLAAAVYLENARIIDPERKDIYESLNFIYSGNRMYAEALEVLEALIERFQPDNRSHELLGYLHYQTGNMDAAIEHLQIAWNHGRGNANTGRGLANAYKKAGMSMSEREVLEQLVEMEPSNAYHHMALGVNLMNEVFESLHELDSVRNAAYFTEQFESSLTELERIEGLFEQAVQVDRNHILANLSAGLFYRNLGFLIVNLIDANPEPMRRISEAPSPDDYFTKSLLYLEHASELDPDQTLIWNALWPVYERLEMPAQAHEARSRAGE